MNFKAMYTMIVMILIGFAASCGTLQNRRQETKAVVQAPTPEPTSTPTPHPISTPDPTAQPPNTGPNPLPGSPTTLPGYDIYGKSSTCTQPQKDDLYACANALTGFEQEFQTACINQGHKLVNCACAMLCSDPVDYKIPEVPEGYQRGFTGSGQVEVCPIAAKSEPSCPVLDAGQIQAQAQFVEQCQKAGNTVIECGCHQLCSAYTEISL